MLGVVILNYNDSENAAHLADEIKGYSSVWRVFIIDNCSTDNSLEQLTERFAGDSVVRVERTERNGGYAYGNNFGIHRLKEAGGDIAIICNSDVSFTEDLVEACVDALEQGYSVVSGLMNNADGSKMYDQNYRISKYQDDLRSCFYFGRKLQERGKIEELVLSPDSKEIREVELLPGSLFAVKIEDYFEVGGLDENTFLYCEERILGRRMQSQGKRLGLMQYVEFAHRGSESINKSYSTVYGKMKFLYSSRMYYQCAYNHIRGG